ncbi:hypothetical protein D3C80_241980 [compost metagenome]
MAFAQTSKECTGICGTIVFKSGNLMPSPDIGVGVGGNSGKPVVREIVIYELTKMSDAESDGPFFRSLKTREIKRVKSDKKGTFSVTLPPGKYSVLVKEDKGLFANISDGDNNINPVAVEKGKMTKLDLVVDYAAAY